MAKILIKNGKVFDGEKFFLADVLVGGEVVSKIEPQITDVADYVFDADGMIVSRGLTDVHTHVKGASSDIYGTPIDVACLPFGVTDATEASAIMGNKDLLNSLGVDVKVFASCYVKNDAADFSVTEEMLISYKEKCIGVKVFFDRADTELKSLKPLKEVCAFAREKGLKVMVHCNHSPTKMEEIVDVLSSGDILTHVYHGGENTVDQNDYAAYHKAKEKGVVLDVGMAGHVHTDFGVVKAAMEKGLYPDTISTDLTCLSTFCRGGRYGLTMAMSIMKDCGMPEAEIFKAVTVNAAKAIGKDGRLKVGSVADLAVLEYANEPYALTDEAGNTVQNDMGYKCRLTVKNGKVLYR